MLDTANRGPVHTPTSEESPSGLGDSRASPVRVEHSVCTREDHDALREWARFARASKSEAAGWLPEAAMGWLKTARPWPDAGLILGECPSCKSTLAICAGGHGAECDGTSDDHDIAEVA